jgi:hypothetical protein
LSQSSFLIQYKNQVSEITDKELYSKNISQSINKIFFAYFSYGLLGASGKEH